MHKNKLGVRIMLGVIVGLLGVGMLLYLVPGQGTDTVAAADVVASVDDQTAPRDGCPRPADAD